MKKTILCGILAVATLFAGCTQDLTGGHGNGTSEITPGPLVTVKVVLDDTRLAVDEAGKISWSEGDQIAVVLKGADGKLAFDTENIYVVDHINNTVDIPENAAYALYPASLKGDLDGTTLSLNLPFEYNLGTPEDIFLFNPMKGDVIGEYLSFKNLFGYMRVPLTGTGVVNTITLKSNCRTSSEFQPLSGECTLNLAAAIADNKSVTFDNTDAAYSKGYAYLRYNFAEGLDLSTSPTVIFPIPAAEYSNLALVMNNANDSYAIYASAPHTINRSKFRTISNTAINPMERAPQEATSLAGTSGTSFEDYASCYIVPPTAGSYSFPAILADGTVLKGGAVAEIKWAEEAGLINDINYDKESNTISFNTNGHEGNALVTLTDNSLTGSGTVWNWHIWVTDAPKTITIKGTGSQKNTSFYVMDRVIGATWAPAAEIQSNLTDGNYKLTNTIALNDANDACGLYYQAQNCIPYPRIKDLHHIGTENISTLENTRCDVMYATSQAGQYWLTSSNISPVTTDIHENGQYVHFSMLYPNIEYFKGGDGTDHSGNAKTVNTWVNANVHTNQGSKTTSVVVSDGNYRFWNSPNNNTYDVISKSKTNHDPCPRGYIMDNFSANYWYAQTRKNDIIYARATDDNTNYTAGYKFYGMFLNGGLDVDNNALPIYWPCCGNRTSGVSSLSGNYGNMGYCYCVQTNNTNKYTFGDITIGYGANIQFGACTDGKTIGTLSPNSAKIVNAQGYNVRCRKAAF